MGVRKQLLFSERSGCWPSWPAASGGPVSPGARAAMRMSMGPWPRWRAASASTASAASRLRWPCCWCRCAAAICAVHAPGRWRWRWTLWVPMALQWYGDRLTSLAGALVVAPETALPLLPQQLSPGYLEAIEQHFASGDSAALLGMPLGSLEAGYTNSVVGFQPGAAKPYRYDKHHLVPFGEFIPPFFRWFTERMNIPLGDFSRGGLAQPHFAWRGERIAPNICYEDLFGEELAAHFRDPANAPTVFVNLSNIGWFGNTLAIDQHLPTSRMRPPQFEG